MHTGGRSLVILLVAGFVSVAYRVDAVQSDASRADTESSRDFWVQFYRSYPGSAGIVGLSRVGFNNAFTQALVYREHLHASMGASGEFVLLTRDAHGWHLAKTFPYWIA